MKSTSLHHLLVPCAHRQPCLIHPQGVIVITSRNPTLAESPRKVRHNTNEITITNQSCGVHYGSHIGLGVDSSYYQWLSVAVCVV